jgi:hypothetical protein
VDDYEAVGRRYGEHLSDHDLLVLAGGRAAEALVLRREPTRVLDLLDQPAVADAVLAARRDEPRRFSYVSPFLVFAAAVHRTGNTLAGRWHVTDRTAPRTRLPLFDGPVLAAFATKPQHRLFLTELLASYARLTSGMMWQLGEHGWQRQRWDELDLPRLAALREALPVDEQLGTSVPRAVVESPQSARRVLALVADRYLFPITAG